MNDDKLSKLWQGIKTDRDELILQMHLAKSELKEEWEKLEKKWPEAESKLNKLSGELEDSTGDLKANLGVIGEELKETYGRIKSRLRAEKEK
ncbi:MAG: hypothetical protein ACJAX5_002272 [Patiriisocius sp.]|jgi:hypothetical protein